MDRLTRREFIERAGAIGAAAYLGQVAHALGRRSGAPDVWGHGGHRYRVVPGWGAEAAKTTSVRDCHEMVQARDGRLFMFGNQTANNMLVFNKDGAVVETWGTEYPGGHGFTLHDENGEQFCYLTDPETHTVTKTTLDGRVVLRIEAPLEADEYSEAGAYKPTETAIGPDGDIYVADGYGSQYLLRYSPTGELKGVYAGPGSEADKFENMHGVALDTRGAEPTLLLTARAQNRFKRFSLDGQHLSTVELPGAWICRPVIVGKLLYFAVIISDLEAWQSNRSGFVAILDEDDRVISCPGGEAPVYSEAGVLGGMRQAADAPFMHPHDVCVDDDGSLYVAQWNSEQTYPVKLERV